MVAFAQHDDIPPDHFHAYGKVIRVVALDPQVLLQVVIRAHVALSLVERPALPSFAFPCL